MRICDLSQDSVWYSADAGPNLAEASALGAAAQCEAADAFAANVLSIVEMLRTAGVTSLAGLAAALNQPRTPRGAHRHATSVRNLFAREAVL
jgi:hypothetical protein